MAGNIPPPNTPLVDSRGNITPEWYRWLSRTEANLGPGTVETSGGLTGGGSISAGLDLSIADGGVTDAKLRNSAACSVIGRFQDSAGPPTDIKAMDNDRVLMRLDDVLVFKQLSATLVGAQPTDATLTALAAYNTNGFLVQTAADTFVGRSLAAPAAGFTITNSAGTAGNPTFVLANDLAGLEALTGSNVIPLRTGTDAWGTLALDTDGTFASNSDTHVATQKATKTYVDQIIAAQDAMVFKGVIDCSANPNYPAADRGHTYRVSVAGKIGGASGINVEVGDLLLCLTDGTASGNQATVGTSWSIAQTNLDGAVIGPASAVNNGFARFSGTTGKLLLDGGTTIATADLAADAVTYAKMQNVSATDKVLGRSSAGAGDPEEISCTAAGRAMIAAADVTAQLSLLRNACWVNKAANLTAQDYTGAVAGLAFDTELYDDGGWHDNVTNNTRLTVPTGVTRVRVGGHVRLSNITGGSEITVQTLKNGGLTMGSIAQKMITHSTSTTAAANVQTGPVPVVAGDYFELSVTVVGDASVDVQSSRTAFWIEAC